jgi:2-iminobutanoate/2-iminopropanoate deaminase
MNCPQFLCSQQLNMLSPACLTNTQKSQAIRTPHAIYVSGQLPADSAGVLVNGTIGDRTAACLQAVKNVLEEAGSSIDKIVKVQIFMTDLKDFAELNVEYEKWVRHKPARSCVQVAALPKGVDVEIECIALP